MFLVGGGAMVLAYSRERTTRDLDAVFEPKALVYEEVAKIAEEEGLPPDWVNDAVKGLLPDQADQGEGVTFESKGISVAIASAEYLFAMKALSARQGTDGDDLVALARVIGITTPEHALAVIKRYYNPSRLTAKASIFIQSLLGPADFTRSDEHVGEVFVSSHMRNGKLIASHWRRMPRSRLG